MIEERKAELKSIAESSVVLAIYITSLGYAVSYAYNFGFLAQLGIPSTFVDISVPKLIFSIGVVLFAGFTIFTIISMLMDFNKKIKNKFLKMFLWILVLGLLVSVILAAAGFLKWKILAFSVSVALMAFGISYITYALRYKSFKKGWQSFIKSFKKDQQANNPLDMLPERLGMFIGVALLAIMGSYGVGIVTSAVQNAYPLVSVNENKKTLIVSSNGQTVITKVYDTNLMKFEGGYSFMDIKDLKNVSSFEKKNNPDTILEWLKD